MEKDLWGGEFWTDGYYAATVGTGGNWDERREVHQAPGTQPTRSPTHHVVSGIPTPECPVVSATGIFTAKIDSGTRSLLEMNNITSLETMADNRTQPCKLELLCSR